MSADEMLPGGRTIEEAQLIVWLLADAGIDCIDVSRGSISHSIHWILPPSGIPPATWITQHTWAIKQAVDIPVIAVGRITDPDMAEFILESGKADLVAFGRALLADAELPNKAAGGRLEDIRYCIGCQGCTAPELSLLTGLSLTCTMNPELGREVEMLPLVRAEKPKRVLVAGGGPGGLEAARVAASRGHSVTLYEKSDRLGGQLCVGALPPGKQELTRGIKWLAIQARKAGAEIEMGKEVTLALVEEVKPDVVIVATGGTSLVPTDIPGINRPRVLTAHDVLTEKVRCGPKVAVLGASMVGCEVADWLGMHRKDVTLVKMRPGTEIGEDVNPFSKPWLIDRLGDWKVKVVTGPKEGIRVKAVIDDGVVIIRDGREETIEADSVVLALGIRPVNELTKQLRGKVAEIHVIGDAKEPRLAWHAIREASEVARNI
jgi:NADPH-dependent 2,4-dienoyl-CoA reductase/sulfur reductase-like enzyme